MVEPGIIFPNGDPFENTRYSLTAKRNPVSVTGVVFMKRFKNSFSHNSCRKERMAMCTNCHPFLFHDKLSVDKSSLQFDKFNGFDFFTIRNFHVINSFWKITYVYLNIFVTGLSNN
jgi:ribosomal protein L31